ncbi:MAG: hypothetical protein WCO78_04805 [Candidatus Roizmanbacteria bacterium]
MRPILKFTLKYAKYILIILVALLLSRGLSTTVFVSGTPQINTAFIAGMMDGVKRGDVFSSTVAFFDKKRITPSPAQSVPIDLQDLSEETKANLIQVAAVAPRTDENGIQIREYGNVAQITLPKNLLEGK